ncbi:hypothetical protein GYMLUDRAFT_252717 [Collybiopsis luxurians FD-317 M1]|uniref:Uncharacterized protein n=1 Tax=Collybiopsis luxurians FD-317 M1 TaxID=944289 RepID=A0A0D0B947_9AGAR|nr:hypothetical protein GYMLUDRAFT_252717 [Collybiopsis luxurians FD-317 M1]
MSMSASGGCQMRKNISEMLEDIDDTFGWKSLAKVLHSCYNALAWALDEDKDDNEDDNDNNDNKGSILSDDSLSDESCLGSSSDSDTDASSPLLTSSTPDCCTCSLHAHHWFSKVNKQCHHLCTLIISYLCTLFELNPSPNLYISIIELSDEPELTCIELLDTLSDIATSSLSTFALALAIYASEGDASEIVKLLNTHTKRCLIRGVAGGSGAGGADAGDGILPPLHPIAFAAMMVGFPVPVPLNGSNIDENDPDTDEGGLFSFRGMGMGGMGLLDMDPDDPDLDDVREELRPRLKERFEGWVEAAMKIKGGARGVGEGIYKDGFGGGGPRETLTLRTTMMMRPLSPPLFSMTLP